MQSGWLSAFWAIGGIVIWIVILSLPLIIYFGIAEVQKARRRRKSEPTFTLGEELEGKDEHPEKRAG